LSIKNETVVGIVILAAGAIFFYMSFQIGSFRFGNSKYAQYSLYFRDIAGITRKSDIRMSGVKVGWVDKVELVDNGRQVRATLMVTKEQPLYDDAYGVVRQEGIIGGKYLELVPGDPALGIIPERSVLKQQNKGGALSMDNVVEQCKAVVATVQEMAESLGEEQGTLRQTLHSFKEAAHTIIHLSQTCDKIIPLLEGNIGRITDSVERDLDRVASQFEQAAGPLSTVIQKINDGQGLVGKLIHDTQTCRDVCAAVQGVKNVCDTLDKLSLEFDSHSEALYALDSRSGLLDAKGYFNVILRPGEDYFYLAGLVTSLKGTVTRSELYRNWSCSTGNRMDPHTMDLPDWARLEYAPVNYAVVRSFDTPLLNLQAGKTFHDLTLRFGMFESSAGVGIDYDLLPASDRLRWMTTLEAFDFRGRNRIDDDRPHLKWLNRLFFSRNLYAVFGLDDFASRCNKSAFFGVGLVFADDDMRYLLSQAYIAL
jgi:phospholipid/cholesterol/gamma-HCH transport system substrate-binding protein